MNAADKRLIAGMREVADFVNGKTDTTQYRVHIFKNVDVKAIRAKVGLSQSKFAMRYGFALDTLQKWEQKTRRPSGAALVLLHVLERNPEAVEKALKVARL